MRHSNRNVPTAMGCQTLNPKPVDENPEPQALKAVNVKLLETSVPAGAYGRVGE